MSQEKILEIIKINPGILQKDLTKNFEVCSTDISRRLMTLLKSKDIKREWSKEFQSFKLFPNP